jgi:thiamine-phosphate pyrophosphorylase
MSVQGLHVLIDPDRVPEAALPSFVRAIGEAGASLVQVRIKNGSTRAALRYIELTLSAARPLGLLVLVNDRVDWALATGADGVHLGQDDMPWDRARALLPAHIIGASAGSAEELARAVAAEPDYIGLGPVFPSPSKADAGPALGLDGFRQLRATVPPGLPVVAIGGIEPENAADVWHAGADGIAVIHAVAGQPDPGMAVRRLLDARPPR